MSEANRSGLDGYTFKARYLPAMVVALPAWLAFALWFPPETLVVNVFASTVVTFVFGAVLAQVGRDGGRRRQQALFDEWGGSPTLQGLSYRSGVTNKITLARCHAALNAAVSGLKLPSSEDEELANWDAAKANYESAADYLRSATRDKERFRLVYAENVNYGFRRNLWGMKPTGIAVTLLSTLATFAHAAQGFVSDGTLPGLAAASLLVCVVMLTLWAMRFTKPWVKTAADAYASQLLAASELLAVAKK